MVLVHTLRIFIAIIERLFSIINMIKLGFTTNGNNILMDSLILCIKKTIAKFST